MRAKDPITKHRALFARIPRAADWRCPDCDYQFRGSLGSYDADRDSLRCPECGREWGIGELLIEHEILDKPTPWWWYGLAAGPPAGWILVLGVMAVAAGEHPTDIRLRQETLLLATLPVNAWLGWWHASRAKSFLSRVKRASMYLLLACVIGVLSMAFTFLGIAIVAAPFAR